VKGVNEVVWGAPAPKRLLIAGLSQRRCNARRIQASLGRPLSSRLSGHANSRYGPASRGSPSRYSLSCRSRAGCSGGSHPGRSCWRCRSGIAEGERLTKKRA
jgi:hypothetical protein